MYRSIARAKLRGGCLPATKSLRRVCRSWTTAHGQSRGFSLIELLVAMMVAVVLLMFAIPQFRILVSNYRLKTTANAFIGSLNSARMAAVQRNTEVQFCSNSSTSNTTDLLGAACNAASPGEVMALNSAATTPAELLSPPPEVGESVSSMQIHGSIAAVRFNGQGQGLQPGTTTPVGSSSSAGAVVVDVCSTALSTYNHIQVNMAAGSVITTTGPSTGTCP